MWERFGSWGHVLEKPTTSLDCREACAREWPFNFNLAHKSVASTVLPILIGQGEEQGFYGESAIVQLVSDGNTNVQLSNFLESCICFVLEKVLLLPEKMCNIVGHKDEWLGHHRTIVLCPSLKGLSVWRGTGCKIFSKWRESASTIGHCRRGQFLDGWGGSLEGISWL